MGSEMCIRDRTKALIRILQEYQGRGFLSFCQAGKRILYYRQPQSFAANQKSTRFARHYQKESGFRTERFTLNRNPGRNESAGEGSPERFFAEVIKQPSFRIELPFLYEDRDTEKAKLSNGFKQAYFQLHTVPLEYIFSMEEG